MSVFRVRITFSSDNTNLSREVWNQNLVGIWYGAWSATDFLAVENETKGNAIDRLSNLPDQVAHGNVVKSTDYDTMRRFDSIGDDDWVLVYFDQTLHLGKLSTGFIEEPHDRFCHGGELFKAREVIEKKVFRLSEIPEGFRLLASAGRSNVHQFGKSKVFADILAESANAAEVNQKFSELDWATTLDALGPKGWETLSLAYLILEKGYLPTGLGVGGTLPDFDIVGRDKSGKAVLAQCKKDNARYIPTRSDLEAYEQSSGASLYIFAYGGMKNKPDHAQLVTKETISHWFEYESNGKQYKKIFSGKA